MAWWRKGWEVGLSMFGSRSGPTGELFRYITNHRGQLSIWQVTLRSLEISYD